MNFEQLIKDTILPLVNNKDAIMIRKMPGESETEETYLILGESDDIARLIGRGGNVADSIREVVSVGGKLENKRIRIKFESFENAGLEE